ncbi:N-acetyltransferase [Shouchella clausii]|uniref:GNAT family N-acetyltransferase n=1 Tax=Shouchella clausii TaxID=79880 RepID=A0A268NX46_SHOCL|nr:GNAT family protein [Shouchella clausii]PAE88093.1 GNAT family N-acetyltransferase [Shouchella clausii]GIN18498.1 N-acetyltransferase [Shouchella clausii]
MKGKNVYLREFKIDDWHDVHAYASLEQVCRYQTWGPNNENDSQNYVKQAIADARKCPRTRFAFAIALKNRERVVGAAELVIDSANSSGAIGYIVHPDYWGQGVATEAATCLKDDGFNRLKLHRIWATCDSRNIASAKVLKKVGMQQEGRLRDHLRLSDGWRDSFVFGLLEDERSRL